MDISSTTSSTMSTADTNVSAQAQKSSKSDSSFKDEMSKVSTEKKEDTKPAENKTKTDNNDKQEIKPAEDNVTVKNEDKSDDLKHTSDLNQALLLSGEINMSALQNTLANGSVNSVIPENIQTLMEANRQLASITMMTDSVQIPVKVDYSTVQMDMNDTQFFTELVQNSDKTLQNVVAELQGGIEQNVQEAAKNVKVSATLISALSEAVKTNQPFRIDFDKDISVIIKVDKDGAITAKFIPGDKAVEEYLKQNMSVLRQRFDEQELSYKDLSYSRQQQRQNQNRRNNKENNHE